MRLRNIIVACLLAAVTAFCGKADGPKKSEGSAAKSESAATVPAGDAATGLMEVTASALTLRSAPADNAATVSCDMFWGSNSSPLTRSSPSGKGWECDGPGCEAKQQSHLPKGTVVTTIERTKEKVTIGKWTNYWYKIDLSPEKSNPGCKTGQAKTAWVFGEFLTPAAN